MKHNPIRQTVFPLLAAFIWGTAFVAQSVSADYVGPFTFNAFRSLIAFAVLLPVSFFFRKRRGAAAEAPPPRYRRELLLGGALCGLALTVAVNLQQKGIETTASGKAGFITALYIVIVPVLGLFFKKRVPWTVWISVAIAVVGLYFLCMQGGFSIAPGDFYLLACSLCFSIQILLIDRFTQTVGGIELSCAQFFTVAALSFVGMLATETPTWAALRICLWPLLYAGVFSSGVAYTLQILAQKDSNPTVVTLLLSLESVFATLAGAILLHDRLSGREYLGCCLMLAAVVLAQLPTPDKKRLGAAEQG